MTQASFGGRLPLLDPSKLDSAQQALLGYLEATKFRWAEASGFRARLDDGRAIGPFNGFLYSPDLARAYNVWIDAETAHTTLTPDVRQVVILTVGTAWCAKYEVYAHVAVAAKAGVDEATVEAIRSQQEPQDASDAVVAAWRLTRELAETRSVSAPVYREAKVLFGERGLVDMLHLIGQYLATAALLNAFEVPAPE